MISSQCSDFTTFKKNLENKAFHRVYPPPNSWFIRSKCQRPIKPRDQHERKTTFKGKPFHGTYENVITSSDGRKQVHTTDQWPYSVHGVIEGKFKDDTLKGTGILIGPNIVLTAGHNLYYPEKKIYACLESLRFKPAINGKLLPFGEVKVEKYFVPDNFVNEEKEDFGILILEEPIGEMTGYFGLACLKPADLMKKKVNITGYPEDKVRSKSEIFEMWEMEGPLEEIDEEQGFISYKIDTGKGQSGSGIVYEENGKYFVCGVHVQGGQNVNVATLLTMSRYERIYTWITEHMRKKLLLYLRFRQKLEFWNLNINVECLSLLLKENLENLKFLDLSGCRISTSGAIFLGQNASWTNLSKLNLSWNNIGSEGAKGLARNTSWVNLSELDFSRNNIGSAGAEGLSQNTSWISLSTLNLSENSIGEEGAKGLGQNASWTNLSKLDLSGNNIRSEGAKGLGRNISWINLYTLYLHDNNIADEGAKGLGQNTSWINLSGLYLFENNIGDSGTQGLGENASWINLSELDLSLNKVGDLGVKGLGRNVSWINLSILDLSDNYIADEGAKGLAQNTSWINLSILDLSDNHIADEGVKGLAQNTSWINLSILYLSNNTEFERVKSLGKKDLGLALLFKAQFTKEQN